VALDLRLDGREFTCQPPQLMLDGCDHLRADEYFTEPPRPTQPPTLRGTGNEYWPKCYDALQLGSKGRMAHSTCGQTCRWQVKLCDPSLTLANLSALEISITHTVKQCTNVLLTLLTSPSFSAIFITGRLPYASVNHRRQRCFCHRRTRVERSAAARNVCTLSVYFS